MPSNFQVCLHRGAAGRNQDVASPSWMFSYPGWLYRRMEMAHVTHVARGAQSPDTPSEGFLNHFSLQWEAEWSSHGTKLQLERKISTAWSSQVWGVLLPQALGGFLGATVNYSLHLATLAQAEGGFPWTVLWHLISFFPLGSGVTTIKPSCLEVLEHKLTAVLSFPNFQNPLLYSWYQQWGPKPIRWSHAHFP